MEDRTHDGRAIKIWTVIDEFSRASLGIVVERRLNFEDVLHCISFTDRIIHVGPCDQGSGNILCDTQKNCQETGLMDLRGV